MNSYSTSWWSLLLINRPREDERLSSPCWLTYSGRLTHKVIIRPARSQAQDRESSSVKDQRSTTVLRGQLSCPVFDIAHPVSYSPSGYISHGLIDPVLFMSYRVNSESVTPSHGRTYGRTELHDTISHLAYGDGNNRTYKNRTGSWK